MNGFSFAVSELTLVLFTTLAPSGAFAFAAMGAPLLSGTLDETLRVRLCKLLFVPLVVAMVGLLAATTHLGNPENALYVLVGIGRSPLSTEVACAVAFLVIAGVFWLFTFSPRFALAAQRVWLVCAIGAAAVFIVTVALAYVQPTIPTWIMWQVPVALCLNALAGGALLALTGLAAAKMPMTWHLNRVLLGVVGAAVLAGAVVYVLQGLDYADIRNAVVSARQLVPGFEFLVVAYLLLCAAGVALAARTLRRSVAAKGNRGTKTLSFADESDKLDEVGGVDATAGEMTLTAFVRRYAAVVSMGGASLLVLGAYSSCALPFICRI